MKRKTISIHGKEYVPVSSRVEEAHEKNEKIDITSEVLAHTPNVVVKATVVTGKGTFTGISAANPAKAIEKQSPYEVAETSAIGRALGFAGYGISEGIASSNEMTYAKTKVKMTPEEAEKAADAAIDAADTIEDLQTVNTQIIKSKIIYNDIKTLLIEKLTAKLQKLDPLK